MPNPPITPIAAINRRPTVQPVNSGFSPEKGNKYGKTTNVAIVRIDKAASTPRPSMPLPKSNARKNKTNVVSTANPRGDETSAASFDIEITFSIFLDKKTARASEMTNESTFVLLLARFTELLVRNSEQLGQGIRGLRR